MSQCSSNFKSVDETMQCDHSLESYQTVFPNAAVVVTESLDQTMHCGQRFGISFSL